MILRATGPLYNVSRWDREGVKVLETVVEGTDYQCALAAYEKARDVYPKDRLTLRHGIRLIRERLPDEPSEARTAHGGNRARPYWYRANLAKKHRDIAQAVVDFADLVVNAGKIVAAEDLIAVYIGTAEIVVQHRNGRHLGLPLGG